MARTRERKIEKRRLEALQPFPEQATYFNDLTDPELQLLMESIKHDGIKHPPEILPDGTLLDGLQRCRAAKALGWDTIDVVVRYDLVGARQEQIRAEFLRPNLCRRQLSKLGQARAARDLLEVERKLDKKAQPGELRDLIGELIGMSGRNLDRYWQVLTTPIEVQRAFDEKQLTLAEACKIAKLPKEIQEEIAERIGDGADARAMLSVYLTVPKKGRPSADDALSSFCRDAEKGARFLADRQSKLSPQAVRKHLDSLRAIRKTVRALIKIAEQDTTTEEE